MPEDLFYAAVSGSADFADEFLGTGVADVFCEFVHAGLAVQFRSEMLDVDLIALLCNPEADGCWIEEVQRLPQFVDVGEKKEPTFFQREFAFGKSVVSIGCSD